jgi:hypothetical protein
MGQLYYGMTTQGIEMPDRLLAHLKVVIATKLRRSESFTLTWRHADGEGRSTIWLQPSIPLRFVFSSAEPELLDSEMLRSLADQAHSAGGVSVDLAPSELNGSVDAAPPGLTVAA